MKTCQKTRIDELISFDEQFGCPVIGTDEAGRGPIAGPVIAGAVYFPKFNADIIQAIKYLDDSKKFSSRVKLRKELFDEIKKVSVYAITECSAREIEKYNILQSSLLAMKRACEDVFSQLQIKNKDEIKILVDGKFVIPKYTGNQKAVIKGDSHSVSIAAASILAKVHRDEIMQKLAAEFPIYDWGKNKGYPTEFHRKAVIEHGACIHHRQNFLSKILK